MSEGRWGHGVSLRDARRSTAAWIFGLFLLAGIVITAAEQRWYRRISITGWASSWILLLLAAAPVVILFALLRLFRSQPRVLNIASLAWGAVAAAAFAGVANEGWGLVVARAGGPQFAATWSAALTAPLVEETLKICGVVLLCVMAPWLVDDPLDGFVLGAMAGLGFAIVEDVFYFMAVFGGTPAGIISGFITRVAAGGVYGHMLSSGLAGLGVGIVMAGTGPPLSRWLKGFSLFLVGMGLHFLWNSPLLPAIGGHGPGSVLVGVVPLAGFALSLVVLVRGRERRAITRLRGDHPEVIGAREATSLATWSGRASARKAVRCRAGASAAKLLGRLQRAQIEAAVSGLRGDRAFVDDLAMCRSLRDALSAIPGALPAARPGSSDR